MDAAQSSWTWYLMPKWDRIQNGFLSFHFSKISILGRIDRKNLALKNWNRNYSLAPLNRRNLLFPQEPKSQTTFNREKCSCIPIRLVKALLRTMCVIFKSKDNNWEQKNKIVSDVEKGSHKWNKLSSYAFIILEGKSERLHQRLVRFVRV